MKRKSFIKVLTTLLCLSYLISCRREADLYQVSKEEYERRVKKLNDKNADMIVLNSLQDKGAGFNTPTNKVSILQPGMETLHLPLLSKEETAERIVDMIFETRKKQENKG